ncbi:MAG: HD domain-containing protein [Desulfobacterales bacterium]
MMKTVFIKDMKAGDVVEDIFVLAEKMISHKKDGNCYLSVTISDKSGSLKGVMWDGVDEIGHTIASGDYVRLTGSISEYRGAPQLVIKVLSPCDAQDVDPSDFLPSTDRDIERMFERLRQISNTFENIHLKSLLEAFYADAEFVNRFKTAPAAKKMHHAYLGGLLEHTLSTALLAEKTAGHYGGVDRELLITGAVLHDIGKTRELTYSTAIDYSDEGRLLSHIVIGVLMVREKIATLRQFPAETEQLIEHMIVSHHGSREFGSPEPPKTIEAILLNYIDEIDAKVNGVREFMESEVSGENWTPYHRLLERQFYAKR